MTIMTSKQTEILECEEDGLYRYTLHVANPKGFEGKQLTVIQINPSKADKKASDPTAGKVQAWAWANGYASVLFLNLFAYRSSKRDSVMERPYDEAVGPYNDHYIKRALSNNHEHVVVAWGRPKTAKHAVIYRRRIREIAENLTNIPVHSVGNLVDDTWPRHGRSWNGKPEITGFDLSAHVMNTLERQLSTTDQQVIHRKSVHEAGHVVVAALCGLPIMCVQVSFVEGGSYCRRASTFDKYLHYESAVTSAAGAVAESIVVGQRFPMSHQSDQEVVKDVISSLFIAKATPQYDDGATFVGGREYHKAQSGIYASLEAHAEELLRQNQSLLALTDIVHQLEVRRYSLSSKQVYDILSKHITSPMICLRIV